ncbi:MAG: alpha/beta fold hydrolase, partial [Rhodospirillaceae bacterium]
LEQGVPETLGFLINRMVERLDASELALVEAASVAGASFPAAAIAGGLGLESEEVESKADGLARRGVLLRPAGEAAWPDGTVTAAYAFQHQLYRDGVYQRLMPAARKRLHRAIGQRLDAAFATAATRPAAEIAMHFVQAGDAPMAVRWLEDAALQAIRRGAHRDAVGLLDRAMALLPSLDDSARPLWELRLLAVRAPTLVVTKGWLDPDAEADYRRACDLGSKVHDTQRQSAAMFGLAAMKEFRGEYLETQAILLRQEAELGELTDPSLMVACSELMACSMFHNARFDEAVEAGDRTTQSYVPSRDIHVVAAFGENPMVSGLCWAGRALWFLGRTTDAVARLDRAVSAAHTEGHAFAQALAHEHMARLRQHMGEPSAALAHATRAVALGEEYGFPYRVASGLVLRGWARAMLGDPQEGLEEIDQGLERCRAVGAVIEYPYFQALQAEALQAAGRPSAGLAVLEEAKRQALSRQGFFYTAEILRLIGRLRLPGDEAGAEEAFTAALATAREQAALEPEVRAALDLSRLWLRQGKARDVRRLVEGLSPPLDRRPAGPSVSELRDLLGTAGASAPVPPMQQVRFCAARDGARIAYSETGHGRPLVKAGNWLTHLEFDWQSPVWQPLFSELSESCRLVRYDPRGTGLSDWHPPEISFEAWVDDLEAMADAAGLDRFALLGLSQGAAVSIAYAARHPERVSHLIILNGYARGRRRRGKDGAEAYEQALNTLIKEGWGLDFVAHRQMFSALFLPEGNPEQIKWFAELERVSTSPENAVRVRETSGACDVSALLPGITVPTLVLHARRDAVVPFEEGRLIAAAIPGARFVSLDSCNHLMLPDEPEWPRLIDEIRHFLRSNV